MNRIKVLIAVIFLSKLTFGQSLNSLMYYPDGKKYKGVAKTIGELNKQLEKHSRVYVYSPIADDNLTLVGYKLFTSEPLWILTDDTTKIKNALRSFELNEFLHSWKFEFELKSYIKKAVLNDLFILETLGQPDGKTKYYDKDVQFESWNYASLGLSLNFKKGIVSSYTKTE